MGQSILWNVLDQKGFYKLQRELGKDEQSKKLVNEIGRKLAEALRLTENQDMALNRLMQSIEHVGGWPPDQQRNNIFKAANLLGIDLPSGMFASTHTAANRVTKKDLRLKNGDVIPKGTPAEVMFHGHTHSKGASNVMLRLQFTGASGRDYQQEPMSTNILSLSESISGFGKRPSFAQMEKWEGDGYSMTPTGKRVEPDGYGPDGSPSWMLVLGLI